MLRSLQKTQLLQREMIKLWVYIRNLPFPFFCSSKINCWNDAKPTSHPLCSMFNPNRAEIRLSWLLGGFRLSWGCRRRSCLEPGSGAAASCTEEPQGAAANRSDSGPETRGKTFPALHWPLEQVKCSHQFSPASSGAASGLQVVPLLTLMVKC